MAEIEGILESMEIINGKGEIKDLGIIVGGIKFYKRIWVLKEKSQRKFKGLKEFLNYEEKFPKEEFFKEVKERMNQKVRIKFRDMNVSLPYYIFDRLICGLKLPKKYREINSIEYLE